jgi:hypothetical protein
VSIPERFWRELELQPDALRRRADFYRDYAAAAETTPEIDALQFESFDGSDNGVIPFFDRSEGEAGPDPDPFLPPWAAREPWIAMAERADALRQATLAMLLASPDRAQELMFETAGLYEESAPVYAMFLEGAINAEGLLDQSWTAGIMLNEGLSYRRDGVSADVTSPARIIHLLLLIGASEAASSEFEEAVRNASAPLDAQLRKPFGTAGSPLSAWLALALALCVRSESLVPSRLAERLVALARPHGDQLAVAKRDTHHWQGLHFRVDLVDLDLAIAVQLVNRRLLAAGQDELGLEDFRARADDSDGLTLLAQISLMVGIELGEDEPDPPKQVPAGVA